MNKNFKTLFVSFLLIAAVSCSKSDSYSSPDVSASERCFLSVSFDDAGTKVSGQPAADENNIRDVQVFVFDAKTKKLDTSFRETGLNVSAGEYAPSSKLDCTRGTREIWALVNAPLNHVDGAEKDRINDVDQLKSLTTRLTDNAAACLVMSGAQTLELTKANESVVISVQRKCAAIVVESITNDILVPAYQQASKVRICGAYLMNVPGIQKYDGTLGYASFKQADWISANQKSSDSSELELTSDTYPSLVLDYGKSLENLSTLYSYPNDCVDDPKSTWAPSRTVLVIEAEIDGQPCIYPIRLGTLESNHKYMVNLTIRHMGCDPDQPWKKVELTNMSASIKVLDWQTGRSIDEII